MALRIVQRGANTRFVQRIMRHSDRRMTERYSHFDPEYLHSKLDEMMRFQPATPKPDPEPVAASAVAATAPAAGLSRVDGTAMRTERRQIRLP